MSIGLNFISLPQLTGIGPDMLTVLLALHLTLVDDSILLCVSMHHASACSYVATFST